MTEQKIIVEHFKSQINPELKIKNVRSKDNTFENWINDFEIKYKNNLTNYCSKFRNYKGKGFILFGNSGTGKTYAIDSVYNRLKEENVVLKTNLSKIYEVLKDNFNVEGKADYSVNRFYKEIKMLDLLIIDDLGSEKKTEWNTEILFNVINICYENNISIIITTNLNDITFKKYLEFNGSDKILDRLKEMCKLYEFKEKIRCEMPGW